MLSGTGVGKIVDDASCVVCEDLNTILKPPDEATIK